MPGSIPGFWIELRGMWNKNITDLNAKEIADAQ